MGVIENYSPSSSPDASATNSCEINDKKKWRSEQTSIYGSHIQYFTDDNAQKLTKKEKLGLLQPKTSIQFGPVLSFPLVVLTSTTPESGTYGDQLVLPDALEGLGSHLRVEVMGISGINLHFNRRGDKKAANDEEKYWSSIISNDVHVGCTDCRAHCQRRVVAHICLNLACFQHRK